MVFAFEYLVITIETYHFRDKINISVAYKIMNSLGQKWYCQIFGHNWNAKSLLWTAKLEKAGILFQFALHTGWVISVDHSVMAEDIQNLIRKSCRQ